MAAHTFNPSDRDPIDQGDEERFDRDPLSNERLPSRTRSTLRSERGLDTSLGKFGTVKAVDILGAETVITVKREQGLVRKLLREPPQTERYIRSKDGDWALFPQSGKVPDDLMNALQTFWRAWRESNN